MGPCELPRPDERQRGTGDVALHGEVVGVDIGFLGQPAHLIDVASLHRRGPRAEVMSQTAGPVGVGRQRVDGVVEQVEQVEPRQPHGGDGLRRHGVGPQLGMLIAVAGDQPLGLAAQLFEVAELRAHPAEPGDHAERARRIGLEGPLLGGEDVEQVRRHCGGVQAALAAADVDAHRCEPAGVAGTRDGELAAVAETVETELADGRQEPVAVSGVVELDQALVDQAGEGVENVDRRDEVIVGGDRFGAVEA